MSPEAVRAAVEEFASRVDSCTPEAAMAAAIDRAYRVDGFKEEQVVSGYYVRDGMVSGGWRKVGLCGPIVLIDERQAS